MNNKIITVVIVVVLIGGGLLLFKNRSVAPTEIEVNGNMPVVGSDAEETEVVKEFNVDAASFSFSPSVISVERGDTVKINVKNVSGTHNFKIDEFNISSRVLNIGETETITFVANKTGTFQYYCSVGNHRAQGMIGTIVVR